VSDGSVEKSVLGSDQTALDASGSLGVGIHPGRLRAANWLFLVGLSLLGGTYVLLIAAMLLADVAFLWKATADRAADPARVAVADESGGESDSQGVAPTATGVTAPPLAWLRDNPLAEALRDRKIRYAIWLSLISCSLSALLSMLVAVPLGYLLSRFRFWGRGVVDTLLDVPIVLPPLVIGLSLLILFQFPPLVWIARSVVYQIPAVVLAQFAVACAFSVRTMKGTFDEIDPRCEQVAMTLGCSRAQAFGRVVLPEADRGMMTAFTLAWARSLGEFGPLLVFAGATRMKTEVLSTSVFLELNVGNIEAAVAVSMIMVLAAAAVLVTARLLGIRLSG
jgi:molybdate transport system permease protein